MSNMSAMNEPIFVTSLKCLVYCFLCDLWKHWHNFILYKFNKGIDYPVWLFKKTTQIMEFETEMMKMCALMKGMKWDD